MGKHTPFRFKPQQQPLPPQVFALDRFGKVIEKGHLVMFHNDVDMICEVTDIGPILQPNAPQGMVQIMLRAQVPVMTAAAQPSRLLAVCGETEEYRAAREGAAKNGDVEPEKEPGA